MTKGILALLVALTLPTVALADCPDEACASVQKILAARSGSFITSSFAKIKGRPTLDSRGDPAWEGTQPIGALIKSCYVYRRGEGSRYEYRCDTGPIQSRATAQKIADDAKAAFVAADAKLVWFDDPATASLAAIEGFRGTEGWYGGYAKNKAMLVKVELVVSDAAGSAVLVTVFAKPVTRRDLR